MSFKTYAYRTFCFFLCFCIANIAFPESPLVSIGVPIRDAIGRKMAADAEARNALAKRKAVSKTRALSAKEMDSMQGRTAQCPYVAGASKWDPSFQGVDLITGNYSTSATDLSFDGGYGIPVNITRSYSANDANEGPFGFGWTMSADVRTTAGGILKGKASPNRSVPTTYKERAPLEKDANLTMAAQPIEAVTAEDASGKQETIQKDADGVLSPAAWDQNQSVSQYADVIQGGNIYQVMVSQTMTTPEGTTYVYQAEGAYTSGGTLPYNASLMSPVPSATPANVLKCVSATDRNGNMTTYSYSGGTVTFNKVDGTTSEHPLTSVQMPNGHIITLTWGNGTTGPVNRVVKVSDNGTTPRVVNYGYTGGNLTSVTSPAGLQTVYGYSTPANVLPGSTDVAIPVISSITDPRGLTSTISSFVGVANVLPYNAQVESVIVNVEVAPNGVTTVFNWNASISFEPVSVVSTGFVHYNNCYLEEHSGNISAPVVQAYFDDYVLSGSSIEVVQTYYGSFSYGGIQGSQEDYYDVFTQNNTLSVVNTPTDKRGPGLTNTLITARLLDNSPYTYTQTQTTTTQNFQSKPLDVTVNEYEIPPSGGSNLIRSATTSYAYWDSTKYYQQKAVKDPGNRISFTDYYTSTDANLGNRGQTYEVFDPKYGQTQATVSGPYSVTAPSGSLPTGADSWRYLVSPASSSEYSAKFVYDSKGRATTIYKLQAATAGTPSTYNYVTNQTTYGADTDGSWGQASQVVEDAGGISRTTKTLGYTSWGKADDVIDAAGHEFQTLFDSDGKVLSVSQVGVGPVATYSYGSSGISNGMVVSVTDGLSGTVDSFAYQSTAGGGIGQVQTISEQWFGHLDNTASYTYDGIGNRATATFRDGAGTLQQQWGYYDYVPVGSPTKGQMLFQTMCQLDGSGNRTPEEFHYAYDAQGRVLEATFAQTPSNMTPDSNGYYDGHLAQTRGRAHYEYDAGGRLALLAHYWDTLNSGGTAYTSEAILAQGCDFENNTGLNRGLKLDSKYYTRTTPGQPNWTLSQTDSYSYDGQLDYLTGASYGDGLANATPAWSYDAAGNRNDAATDNLNRATSLGGVSCTNDILGNLLAKGTSTFGWNSMNRMTSFSSSTQSLNFAYRGDGMRFEKKNTTTGTTNYTRHDGQMPYEEEDFFPSAQPIFTKYGLGSRGIDAIYVLNEQTSTNTSSYPIYDAHGNMISALTRQGTGGYSFGALRTYDAWGNVRLGAPTGDPRVRYCANLGHKQDDESGLIYMRSREYDPLTGRFLSQDRGQDGFNWYIYSHNNPINLVDRSGCDEDNRLANAVGIVSVLVAFGMLVDSFMQACAAITPVDLANALSSAASAMGVAGVGGGFLGGKSRVRNGSMGALGVWFGGVLLQFSKDVEQMDMADYASKSSDAFLAVTACGIYTLVLMGMLISDMCS